jgi:hypothetical protein
VLTLKRTIVTVCALLFAAFAPCHAYNVYYGNLHSHTSYSDGIGTPTEAYLYARDSADVDVQGLTDHTHMMTTSEYSSMRSVAATYTQDGVFVAIAGQEHGNLSTSTAGAFGHINFYEATSLIPQYDNGGKDFRCNLSGTYNWIFTHTDGITGAKLFGAFNHPYETAGTGADAQFHQFAYSVTGDSAMSLFEIRNGRRADNYEPEFLEALANGWHIGAAANQDNHDGMWGDSPNPNSGNDIYLTGILSNSLTKAAILAALRDRRTFAVEVNPATDRMAVLFQCETHWMGERFTAVTDTVHFDVTVSAENNFISLQLIRNGVQIASVNPGSNSYHWLPKDRPPLGENYYYVKAQQVDGDYMWSSPIWVVSTSGGWNAISQVNEDNANGEPVMLGLQVTLKGIATVATGTFSTVDNDIFIQDATGGVDVYKRNTQTPNVSVGDSVMVVGYVDQYFGLTRITSPTITLQVAGVGAPEPQVLTTAEIYATGEAYEGSLVKVVGVLVTGGTWPALGFDGSVTIDDGSGGCTLFIDKDTDIDGTNQPACRIDVTGVVTQYDNTLPYFSGYRIVPRSTADIPCSDGAGVPRPEPGALSSIHPNPAHGSLKVVFGTNAARGPKQVSFYDVTGRLVREVASPAGEAFLDWKGDDSQGSRLPSGIYFAVIRSAAGEETAKVVLVR